MYRNSRGMEPIYGGVGYSGNGYPKISNAYRETSGSGYIKARSSQCCAVPCFSKKFRM